MSGLCAHPQTAEPDQSHRRCSGGNEANPNREWQPCPCHCHLGEEFECGCGRPIREAPLWQTGYESDLDEMVYVHIEPTTGRAVGEECS
jgi:hypothetical protein